jgi:putative nucleotidyltransferase with HDIG domain
MSTTFNLGFEFIKKLGEDLDSADFDLPPFPESALRLQSALSDPDVTIEQLSMLVLSEPMLAARLLRMSNSVGLRGRMEITDVKTAISRIGLDMVQNAAVSFAAREAFQAPSGSPLLKRLDEVRKHSILVSVLAYSLAQKVRFVGKPDEAMLAGLLHAVGKLYILMGADAFPDLSNNEEALETVLSEWHTGVGRAIVESWGFPENIVDAVDEHELQEREEYLSADITDLVLVANLIALENRATAAEGNEPDKLAGLASLSRMNIDVDQLRTILQESEEEIRSMTEAMSG